MSNAHNTPPAWHPDNGRFQFANDSGLGNGGAGGGWDGTPPGMTDLPRRVGKLEDGFGRISEKQSEINVTLVRMDEKLGRMASTEFVRQEISTAVDRITDKLREAFDPIKQTASETSASINSINLSLTKIEGSLQSTVATKEYLSEKTKPLESDLASARRELASVQASIKHMPTTLKVALIIGTPVIAGIVAHIFKFI